MMTSVSKSHRMLGLELGNKDFRSVGNIYFSVHI